MRGHRRLSQSKSVISRSCQPMCCALEQGTIHRQGGQLSHSKPMISRRHQPIVFHNRRECNAPSMGATLTKQAGGVTHPPVHAHRTGNPRRTTDQDTIHRQNEQPSQSKPAIAHSHQPMCCTIEQGTIHLLGRVALTKQLGDIPHSSAHP